MLVASVMFSASVGAQTPTERPEWAAVFEAHEATGTIVVLDERAGASDWWVANADRAAERFSPASTFKIPHALFALAAGVVTDEFQVFPWDGEERVLSGTPMAAWNRDQTLRSSIRNSVIWVYQWFAVEIGEEQARAYLASVGYGNADPTGGEDGYWLDGALRISALEQVGFLRRLCHNALPFDEADQRLVKDIMVNEAGPDWILRAKTGWSGTLGWWVGWIEWPTGVVYFALNIDTPNRFEDLGKRQAITRQVLGLLDAAPASWAVAE